MRLTIFYIFISSSLKTNNMTDIFTRYIHPFYSNICITRKYRHKNNRTYVITFLPIKKTNTNFNETNSFPETRQFDL